VHAVFGTRMQVVICVSSGCNLIWRSFVTYDKSISGVP